VTELEDLTTIPYLTFICRYRTHEFGYTKDLTAYNDNITILKNNMYLMVFGFI